MPFLFFDENGIRKARRLGTFAGVPTREAAERMAKAVRRELKLVAERTVSTVKQLVEQYKVEKMPDRATTKRGYNSWLKNHILPRWGNCFINKVKARPVELWLQSLKLSPKSRQHIRTILGILLDYPMWRGDVPTERNPMELVKIQGINKGENLSPVMAYHKEAIPNA